MNISLKAQGAQCSCSVLVHDSYLESPSAGIVPNYQEAASDYGSSYLFTLVIIFAPHPPSRLPPPTIDGISFV